MSDARAFRPVRRNAPCEVCGKPDWCRRSGDGANECHRISEPTVNGYKRIATTRKGFAVYRHSDERQATRPIQTCAAPVTKHRIKPPRRFKTVEAAAQSFARWKGGTVETIYRWTDDWYRARIRLPGDKTFCEITRDDDAWVQRGPETPHLLYRAEELPAKGRVFICEGEKSCDAGWSIGLPCVTSGGCDSANSADWSGLAGREVCIIGDNDVAGAKYADEVARQLTGLDPPAIVKDVRLPGLAEKGDLYDFISTHRDSKDSQDVREEIMGLADAAPKHEGRDESNGSITNWPEPQALPDERPPVMAFVLDLLPQLLRRFVQDIAERIQCPPDFPAIAMVIVIAAVVGRKVGIRPKRQDDWLVVPNLWGAAVGPPSVMKTPAIEEPMKLLKRLEVEAKRRFDQDERQFEAKELVAKERKKAVQKQVSKALEENEDDAVEIAMRAIESGAKPPVRRRYIVHDSTVEKLGELLNENGNGLLVFRDELIGFLKAMEKEGQEGARSFYLEAWNGLGRYTYDRIGRGTVEIDAAIVSILGSIQPGPLQRYVRGAVHDCEGADGLMQRFQLAVYPDISGTWQNIDRWPDTEAKNNALQAVRYLDELDPVTIGAQTDPNNSSDAIPYLRFDSKAQDLFDQWREKLELRLRSETEHPVIVAHLAKYRSLIPSLALLFHLCEKKAGAVGIDSLERAIAWGEYLETHARRIYAGAVAPDMIEANALARKILAGEVKDRFALRDIYRKGWIGLTDRDAAARAVEVLVDLDWLVAKVEKPPTGAPGTVYHINPRIKR